MKELLIIVSLIAAVCFFIGLFNFLRFSPEKKRKWLSQTCSYPEKRYSLSLVPLVILSYGFLTVMFCENLEKEQTK